MMEEISYKFTVFVVNQLIYDIVGNADWLIFIGIIAAIACFVNRLRTLGFIICFFVGILSFFTYVIPMGEEGAETILAGIYASPYLFDKWRLYNIFILTGNGLLILLFWKLHARKTASGFLFIGFILFSVTEFGYWIENHFISVGIPYEGILWLDGNLLTILFGIIAIGIHKIRYQKKLNQNSSDHDPTINQLKDLTRITLYRRIGIIIYTCTVNICFTYAIPNVILSLIVSLMICLILVFILEPATKERIKSALTLTWATISTWTMNHLHAAYTALSTSTSGIGIHQQKNSSETTLLVENCGKRTISRSDRCIDGIFEPDDEDEIENEYILRKRNSSQLVPESCVSNRGKARETTVESENRNKFPFRKTAPRPVQNVSPFFRPQSVPNFNQSRPFTESAIQRETQRVSESFLQRIPAEIDFSDAELERAVHNNEYTTACDYIFMIFGVRARQFIEIYFATRDHKPLADLIVLPERLFDKVLEYGEIEGQKRVITLVCQLKAYHSILCSDPQQSKNLYNRFKSCIFTLLEQLRSALRERDESTEEDELEVDRQ